MRAGEQGRRLPAPSCSFHNNNKPTITALWRRSRGPRSALVAPEEKMILDLRRLERGPSARAKFQSDQLGDLHCFHWLQ